MEESLGEPADGAGFVGGLQLVHAGERRRPENTVDALLRRESRALQVRLRSQLLGHGQTL